MKKNKLQKAVKKGSSGSASKSRPPTSASSKKTIKPVAPTAESDASFPIVGIGASAGGLAAFEAFFSGMPPGANPGMAFVLVQHLAPDHKSLLTELVRRYTRMQVFEVEDGMKVQPDCVYIIPPNRDLALLNGLLQLLPPTSPRGLRLPIDHFFRTLAEDQHERAICIVLSGTGSDGSQGVRAVKAEGGMVMVQSPNTAEHDGMPRAAINTGMVDYELPPSKMPPLLMAYASHSRINHSSASMTATPAKKKRKHTGQNLYPAAIQDRARFFPVQTQHHPAPH